MLIVWSNSMPLIEQAPSCIGEGALNGSPKRVDKGVALSAQLGYSNCIVGKFKPNQAQPKRNIKHTYQNLIVAVNSNPILIGVQPG